MAPPKARPPRSLPRASLAVKVQPLTVRVAPFALATAPPFAGVPLLELPLPWLLERPSCVSVRVLLTFRMPPPAPTEGLLLARPFSTRIFAAPRASLNSTQLACSRDVKEDWPVSQPGDRRREPRQARFLQQRV